MKENLRGTVFLSLFIIGIVVTSVSVSFPVAGEVEDKVKLMESICLGAISFFGMLIGGILAATSVPKEIEDRSIYSIITKPVNWLNLLLGKVIGLTFIAGITVVFMGCLGVILIRHEASKSLQRSIPAGTGIATDSNLGSIISVVDIGSSPRLIARRQITPVSFSIDGKHHETPARVKWIEGGGMGTAIWDISGLNRTQFGKQLEVEMNLYFEGGETYIPLEVSVGNTATNRTETVTIDAPIGKRLIMGIDSEIAKGTDQIVIKVSPKNRGQYIGLREEGVRIFHDQKSFEWNFFKAVVVASLQIVLIIFIGATSSALFVTPAVSMLLVLFISFCGYMVDYIKDISSVIVSVPDLHDHVAPHEVGEIGAFRAMFNLAIQAVLGFIAHIVPDFGRFNMGSFIVDGIDIPFKRMLVSSGYASLYLCVCIGISAIAVRKKEV